MPSQLPADIRHFVGRSAELAALDQMLRKERAEQPAPCAVAVIGGTSGVGKTALAIHWARLVAHRFPDGQLYASLNGFGPSGSQLAPAEVLRQFLEALGVQPAAFPASLEDRAALYQAKLAGRAVLVILDNARDVTQVQPLLSSGPCCLTLITSRNDLDSIHATGRIALERFSELEAAEFLACAIGPERVAAEKLDCAELARLCDRLPLALDIVAAGAAVRTEGRLATLTTEFGASAQARRDAGDVRTVISWSHRALNPPTARLFRLLGLHPGPEISVPLAASLAGCDIVAARAMLEELAGTGLLSEHSPDSYTCHDMLRAYAAESAVDGQRAVIRRMLDYYLHTAHAASGLLVPARPALPLAPPAAGVVPEELTGRDHAFSWLSAQRTTLITLTSQAADLGFDSHAWQLPWALATFLDMQGWWSDWAATQRIALAAAQRLGDVPGQAHAHRSIGCAYMRLESPQPARTHLRRAVRLFVQLGDQVAVARCQLNVAHTFEQQHRYHEALRNAVKALTLTRASDDRQGQASALNAIGWCQLRLGEYQLALSSCQQALDMHYELGDRRGEAAALDSIGCAHHRLGQHSAATACCSRAADLNHDLGDREAETEALVHLGDAQLGAGNAAAARATWRRALVVIEELGLPRADEVRGKLRHLGSSEPAASAGR